jgi:DNA-binding LytR/AlgR family response regulator
MARVMIVEDEWLVAEDHAATLRQAGHEIVGPCPNVEAALNCARQHPIDAALLDMQLGGEKSFRVADLLKELNVPFMFASGYELLELPERMRGYRVLSKPVSQELIVSAVEQMCMSR